MVVILQPARFIVDDAAKTRYSISDRMNLVDLFLIFDDRQRHLCVRQNIGHLLGDGVGIDRHRHRAERLSGADRPIESGTVPADDRTFVAVLEPKLGKPDRESANLFERLAPRPSLPNAEVLVADGRPPADRASIVDQKLGYRIWIGRQHGHSANHYLPDLRAASYRPATGFSPLDA